MFLEHYRTAPKHEVTLMLKNHLDIDTLHPLYALKRFMWLFSI